MTPAYVVIEGGKITSFSGFRPKGDVLCIAGDDIQVHVSDDRVVLERGLTSAIPVYYAGSFRRLFIATDWPFLVEMSGMSQPDIGWLHDYIGFQCPLTQLTPVQGVSQLRVAEQAVFSPAGRCHDLPSFSMTHAVSDISHFESSIEPGWFFDEMKTAVEQLPSQSFFHISAGLDSSLLVLLARRVDPSATPAVVSFRALGRGASDELDIVQRLADDYDLDLTILDFTDIDIFQAGHDLIPAIGFPLAHPSQLARFLMDRDIANMGGRTIVTGRGADETLGGYIWHRPEYTGDRHLSRVRATLPEDADGLLPGVSAGQAYDSYAAFFDRQGYDFRSRQLYDLATIFNDWNTIDRRLAKALSVEYRHPMADPDMMRGLLSLPETACIDAAGQKLFMRQVFADVYPEYVLNQVKRGLSFDMGAYFQRYGYEEIMQKLYADSALSQRYVDMNVLADMVSDTLVGQKNYGWQLWSLYLASITYERVERLTRKSS